MYIEEVFREKFLQTKLRDKMARTKRIGTSQHNTTHAKQDITHI